MENKDSTKALITASAPITATLFILLNKFNDKFFCTLGILYTFLLSEINEVAVRGAGSNCGIYPTCNFKRNIFIYVIV